MKQRKFIAIDPETGARLRRATPLEVKAYREGNKGRPCPFNWHTFDNPVRVGKVTITTYTGPGEWHIPGRFLP